MSAPDRSSMNQIPNSATCLEPLIIVTSTYGNTWDSRSDLPFISAKQRTGKRHLDPLRYLTALVVGLIDAAETLYPVLRRLFRKSPPGVIALPLTHETRKRAPLV